MPKLAPVLNLKNTIRWSPIELTVRDLFPAPTSTHQKNRGHWNVPRSELNAALFETPCVATAKFDGTNVGKDEHGVVYGRNLVIDPDLTNYQKTQLDGVNALDARTIKDGVCGHADVDPDQIARFCVYGELMCNSGLYDYARRQLGGTYQVFGAMVQPAAGVCPSKLGAAFQAAGFATSFNDTGTAGDAGDGDGDNAADAAAFATSFNDTGTAGDAGDRDGDNAADTAAFKILMSEPLAAIVQATGASTVPLMGPFASFAALVEANFDHLRGGHGEGLIVTMARRARTRREVECGRPLPAVPSCRATKWKIGSESNPHNTDYLDAIAKELAEDTDRVLFGPNTDRAKALLDQLLEVLRSRLINGVPPVVNPGKGKAKPKTTQAAQQPPTEAEYAQAIKSAASKFDAAETFFKKGKKKGAMMYAKLIADEALADIPVDASDTAATKRHTDIVAGVVKQEFVAWNRKNNRNRSKARSKAGKR